jgi:HSP90 family molecular chaperone
VFVRELISNASDALEKVRHQILELGAENVQDSQIPLEVHVFTDPQKKILTIQVIL